MNFENRYMLQTQCAILDCLSSVTTHTHTTRLSRKLSLLLWVASELQNEWSEQHYIKWLCACLYWGLMRMVLAKW